LLFLASVIRTRIPSCSLAWHLHRRRNRRQPPDNAGAPQQLLASSVLTRLHTPVSGSTSSTRSAASRRSIEPNAKFAHEIQVRPDGL